jgi:outer membrane protein OmpA-like peptidoglycan-associated protein/N-acetylmuramoyl-L-alanine amidase
MRRGGRFGRTVERRHPADSGAPGTIGHGGGPGDLRQISHLRAGTALAVWRGMTKHVIDAGHGPRPGRGSSSRYGNRGAVLGLAESDVTYRIASAMARYLGPGANVTRSLSDNPSLRERAGMARMGGVRTFLSVHANSGGPGQRGSQAFVHPRAGGRSVDLARAVQRALGGLGLPAPEVTPADMAVLDPDVVGPDVAACLIEVDYLSDAAGERRLGDARAIEEIARVLARAVDETSGGARFGQRRATARPLDNIPAPTFDPSNPIGWLQNLMDWTAHFVKFSIGITDASIFPHSSICHLEMQFSDGNPYTGTGFYISPSRILTAGHVVADSGSFAKSIRVRPGRTGAASVHDFTVLDRRFFHQHPSYSGSEDFDLSVLEVPVGPNDGRVFAVEEQRASPSSGVIECGYAADEQDATLQHCDTGSIVDVLAESYTFDLQDRHGSSGSPVFYVNSAMQPVATGIGVSGWRTGSSSAGDAQINVGCRLTDAKLDWIWSFGFSLYFDHDSTSLRTDVSTTSTLAQLVDYLNSHPGKNVDVDGHASPEGDASHNQDLARGRAAAVAAYLRSQGLGARVRTVTGRGTTFGAAHAAAEFDGDRRAVVLPV